ncbi:hypothetical protein [Solicola sp. PLA-1-18]|uniref:hypothetical protein n=1 Tax=Solicola sp. PLA-1-18 TaxID=3380532 RepID=UPI003B783FC9
MKIYRRAWATGSTTLLAAGMVLCLVLVPTGVWASLGLLTGCAAFAAHHQGRAWASQARVDLVTSAAAVSGAVTFVIALWGFAAVSAGLALGAALAIALFGLPVVLMSDLGQHLWARYRRPHPIPPPRNLAASGAADREPQFRRMIERQLRENMPSWSDDELCWHWRSSYTRLHRATPMVRCTIVLERQLCLDELERRHPSGVAAWLASGARAAGNPAPYLTRTPHHDDHGSPP